MDSLSPVVFIKGISCGCGGGHLSRISSPKGSPDFKGGDDVLTACKDASGVSALLEAVARCRRDECDEARAVVEVPTRKAVVIRVQSGLTAGAASKARAPRWVIVERDP